MNKRGALFYIIDAFVAASIIAITITIIFSTSINIPETEIIQEAMESYITYLEKTSLVQVSGPTANSIINQELVNNQEDPILSSIAQLYARKNVTLAQALITEVSDISLGSNYGLNVTINGTEGKTTLITRNTERLAKTKTYLQKSMVTTVQIKAQERMTTKDVIAGTGIATCAPDTCKYIIDSNYEFFEPLNHNEATCPLDATGLQARCYGYNASKTSVYTITVSVWS